MLPSQQTSKIGGIVSHFTGKKLNGQNLSNLSMIPQLLNGRADNSYPSLTDLKATAFRKGRF